MQQTNYSAPTCWTPKPLRSAVAGSVVTYLVAGLKYDHKVWQEQWPKVMRNAMDACKRHGSTLVFFDNVYAYGLVHGVMTEDTPYNPCSRKGEGTCTNRHHAHGRGEAR